MFIVIGVVVAVIGAFGCIMMFDADKVDNFMPFFYRKQMKKEFEDDIKKRIKQTLEANPSYPRNDIPKEYGFGIGLNYFVTISMVAWKFWPNIKGILAINISNHLKDLLLD